MDLWIMHNMTKHMHFESKFSILISCTLYMCKLYIKYENMMLSEKASSVQIRIFAHKDSGDKNRLLFTLRCFWDPSHFTEPASGSRSACVAEIEAQTELPVDRSNNILKVLRGWVSQTIQYMRGTKVFVCFQAEHGQGGREDSGWVEERYIQGIHSSHLCHPK